MQRSTCVATNWETSCKINGLVLRPTFNWTRESARLRKKDSTKILSPCNIYFNPNFCHHGLYIHEKLETCKVFDNPLILSMIITKIFICYYQMILFIYLFIYLVSYIFVIFIHYNIHWHCPIESSRRARGTTQYPDFHKNCQSRQCPYSWSLQKEVGEYLVNQWKMIVIIKLSFRALTDWLRRANNRSDSFQFLYPRWPIYLLNWLS